MQGITGFLILTGMWMAGFFNAGALDIWVTAIAWYGYILWMDWLTRRRGGCDLLAGRRREFLVMLPVSVLLWYLFEFHNLLFKNWEYTGLPENEIITSFAMMLSFATILPAMYLTHAWLQTFPVFHFKIRARVLSRSVLRLWMFAGVILILISVVFASVYTGPLIWLGYLLFIPALNAYCHVPGILKEREQGNISETLTLGCAGLICGFVWEGLNYWAAAKWLYHVPYLENVRIFEMPVLGFLGFFPFGIIFIEMYRFLKYAAAPRLL